MMNCGSCKPPEDVSVMARSLSEDRGACLAGTSSQSTRPANGPTEGSPIDRVSCRSSRSRISSKSGEPERKLRPPCAYRMNWTRISTAQPVRVLSTLSTTVSGIIHIPVTPSRTKPLPRPRRLILRGPRAGSRRCFCPPPIHDVRDRAAQLLRRGYRCGIVCDDRSHGGPRRRALASRPLGPNGLDLREQEPLSVAGQRPRTRRRLIVLRAPAPILPIRQAASRRLATSPPPSHRTAACHRVAATIESDSGQPDG